ncbi:MAG: GNAT family N-acetyltransferase [Blastocatellia bacterium]
MLTILQAETDERLDQARLLFAEYIASLGFDTSFQNVADELARLPGCYAPPSGCLLLALHENRAAGCVALKKLDDQTCEMKRLYVRPSYRNLRIGKALVDALIREAQVAGYRRMRLTTVMTMERAISIYQSWGFKEIPAYCYHPVPGTVFMELMLPRSNEFIRYYAAIFRGTNQNGNPDSSN